MIELSAIRAKNDDLITRLAKRGKDFSSTINEIILLDEQVRAEKTNIEDLQRESNQLSKEIGLLFREGKGEEANAKKERTSEIKTLLKDLQDSLGNKEAELQRLLYIVPNAPHPSVPAGTDDTDNEVVSEHGKLPNLQSNPLPHWEITEKYGLIDFEVGTKITGAGFPVYKGDGARLQRALIQFFLDQANKAGYEEIIPPLMVNEASGIGTGQLPDKDGQMYHVQEDSLYLIPTAEVPITNIYRNEIVKESDFPIKMCGYTPCFRREAGSYGKDVRGLNRLHQFDKVELVQLAHPNTSYDILDEMVAHVKGLLDKLELPYRILRLCGGDLGFTAALTYDFEVYSAAQERWLEVSSVSNFETFQANRLKLRYKSDNGNVLAHTLNGSGLALPRILAALLENNQTEKGIHIPEALQPYFKKEMIC